MQSAKNDLTSMLNPSYCPNDILNIVEKYAKSPLLGMRLCLSYDNIGFMVKLNGYDAQQVAFPGRVFPYRRQFFNNGYNCLSIFDYKNDKFVRNGSCPIPDRMNISCGNQDVLAVDNHMCRLTDHCNIPFSVKVDPNILRFVSYVDVVNLKEIGPTTRMELCLHINQGKMIQVGQHTLGVMGRRLDDVFNSFTSIDLVDGSQTKLKMLDGFFQTNMMGFLNNCSYVKQQFPQFHHEPKLERGMYHYDRRADSWSRISDLFYSENNVIKNGMTTLVNGSTGFIMTAIYSEYEFLELIDHTRWDRNVQEFSIYDTRNCASTPHVDLNNVVLPLLKGNLCGDMGVFGL